MLRKMDLLLLGVVIGLTLFGLAMIASVSVFKSFQITSALVAQGLRASSSNALFLQRSAMNALIGIVLMFITAAIPYRTWERFARPLFLLTIVLLIIVFLPGIRNEYGTAQSWLVVGGFSFQPSELLKVTLIFYLAVWLQKKEQSIATWKEGFVPFVILLLLSTFLVAIQPDLGSFIVLSAIAATMFFIAGGNVLHLFMGGGLALIMGLPLILSKKYVRQRFEAWIDLENHREGVGYQIQNALIAVGSGGPFGVGYGKSIQKFGYLPEVQADMIFAAMAEELGFFRLLIVLGMYAIIIIRGYEIARHAPDRFGFLVAVGITTWIAFQSLLNMAINTALFPITGLTLPFISYGGSSLITLLIAVGVLLNISTYSTEHTLSQRRTSRTWKFAVS